MWLLWAYWWFCTMSPTTELQPVDGLEVYAPYFFSLTKSFIQSHENSSSPLHSALWRSHASRVKRALCLFSFFLSFFFLYCIWFPSCFLRFRLNHLEFPAAEEPVPVVVTPNGWTREGGRNKEEKREHDGEIEGKLRAKQGSVQRKAKRS